MPCYSPLQGYMSKSLTTNGKRKITFSRNSGFTDMPVTVPCGQCIGCRIDRSRMWAIRCVHESKMHQANCFATLTYENKCLPPDYGLQKVDLQKFFKRLRKAGFDFRYFACGEYGENLSRPHYHVIFFGIDFTHDRKKHSENNHGILYTSETLSSIWGKGHCIITDFSYATAAYTARYVMKKQMGKGSAEHENYSRITDGGEIYQVAPEFAVMSLRPGIGSSWYQRFKSDAFPSDYLVHEGKKHPVPRYYLNKLVSEQPEVAERIKRKRNKARLTSTDSTPERLHDRETVKKAQLSQLKRSI